MMANQAWKRALDRAGVAFVVYLAVACVVTWPAVINLTRRLPLDLGDPLLNSWILAWDWSRLLRFAQGDLGALRGFWNAGIFYPEPLALAYSEHLVAQAFQALPLFALTREVVLCYNVLFLSTFALSGLGAFLFVRQITGDGRAAFVGGLLYAFAPYRMTQIGHLQVLSSQWMPFALFGLARWFDGLGSAEDSSSRAMTNASAPPRAPLVWATVALVAQNLSCGYYLVFFTPVVTAYVLWEVGRRGLWRHVRMWMWLAAAAAVVVAATAPFLLPYLAVRQHGFRPRPLEEVRRYSADVYSYLRGLDDSIWRGWLTDFTREEGTLFPGLVPVVLAAVGIAAAVRQALVRARTVLPAALWRQTAATLLGGVAALSLLLALFELFAGPAIQRIRDLWFPLALVGNVLAVFGMAVVGWLASSPRARLAACAACRCPPVFFLGIAAVAVWLSFGPVVETKGFRLTDQSVYVWL